MFLNKNNDNNKRNIRNKVNEVKIYPGLKRIGSRAFSGIKKLPLMSLPISITSMGSYIFDGNDYITSINIREREFTDRNLRIGLKK